MNNKRIFTRLDELSNIKIKTQDNKICKVKNLSLGGIGVNCDCEIKGDKKAVPASLLINDENIADVKIEFVHKGTDSLGFRFVNISQVALQKLKQELEKRSGDEHAISNEYFWIKLHQK